MSKFELRERAFEAGGVTYEESLKAGQLVPSLYERLGKESGMEELSRLFYDRVFADASNPWFLNIFASSTKAEAIDNQYRFFVQTFGGPDLYRQKGKGRFTRLAGRHAAYPIGHRAADRWIMHMEEAINEHPKLQHLPDPASSSLSYRQKCNLDDDDHDAQSNDTSPTTEGEDDEEDEKKCEKLTETMMTETKEAMRAYFIFTAHYIVVASEYMRDDQLSGGTQMDAGRVW